jgi:hypothetical protein
MVLRVGDWIWRNSIDDWSSKRRVGSVYYCEEVGFRISAIWRQTTCVLHQHLDRVELL